MNYLTLFLLFFLVSCSSDKNLVDIEYYMKQGKEVSLNNKFELKEIKKINELSLSKPILIDKWLSSKLNTSNNLPRFQINDFNKKISIDINAKSFLALQKNIYLIDKNSNIFVINENLKELKKISLYKKKDIEDYTLDFSMTSDGKLIYISDNLGNIHCVNINTLKIEWLLKLGVPIKSDLYLNNNDLFFINTNSKLFSIKSSNGGINWSHETASKISKEKYQISISNNLLFANNDYGEIFCYDLIKKNILWKLSLDDKDYQIKFKNFKIAYPVNKDGIMYLSSNFGETIAIEELSGKILWKKLISTINLPIINNNYVFLINHRGFFYILNKKNGDVIYSKDLSQFNSKKTGVIFYDIILGKDYIYFINSGNNLIKLNLNNLSSIKNINYSLNNPKNYFVLNNNLFILEDQKLLKFYN